MVASGQWLPDMRSRAGAIDALGGAAGDPARVVSIAEIAGSAADVVVFSCCGRSATEAVPEVNKHFLSRCGDGGQVWRSQP